MRETDIFKLTANQKKVLHRIIQEGRISDTKISKEMNISQQAVFKIREHLEDIGVIEGYAPLINFEKIGIHVLHFMGIEVKSKLWNQFKETEINNKLLQLPMLFELYRVPLSKITHIMVFGFKDIDQVEKFMKKMKSSYSEEFEIKWQYSFSVKNIISQSPLKLFYDQLGKDSQILEKGFIKFDNYKP